MAKKVKKTKKKAAAPTKSAKKTVVKKVKKAAAKKTSVKKTVQKKARKKTAAKTVKKSPSSSKTRRERRMRRKTTLSKAELVKFQGLLIEKLKEIMGDVDHIELESLKKSRLDASGDLSSMPIHMADIGSDNYEQEFSLELMDSERKIVQEIHAALGRIADGTYGICEGTGDPIQKVRLEGIPWARHCIKYAEMLEKGLVGEEDRWYDYDDDDDENEVDEDDDEELDEDEAEKEALFYGYDNEDDEELV